MALIFPLNEPIGSKIRESITGEFISFDNIAYPFATYPERIILCEGVSKYINIGYCQGI